MISLSSSAQESIDSLPREGQIDHSFTKKNTFSVSNELMVVNSVSSQVGFHISLNKRDWKSFKLNRGEKLVLSANDSSIYYLRIYTNNSYRNYILKKSKKYSISYSTKIMMYVINEVYFD